MKKYVPRYLMIVLASTSLTLGTFKQHQLDTNYLAILFNSLGVYLIYNRYQVVEKNHPFILKSIYFLIFIISCITGIYYIKSLFSFLIIGIIAILGLLYTTRLPLIRKPLRDISGLKLLLVISSWFYVILIFPIQNELDYLNIKSIDIFTLLMIFVVGFGFDIRDYKIDAPERKTLPQVLGIPLSIVITNMLLLICLCAIHIHSTIQVICYSIAIILVSSSITRIKNHQNKWYGSILELSLVIWGLGMYLQ